MVWWLRPSVRKGQQPPWIVPDALWERIEPLLPVVPRRADVAVSCGAWPNAARRGAAIWLSMPGSGCWPILSSRHAATAGTSHSGSVDAVYITHDPPDLAPA
jgi:hypothetical protein